MTLFLRTNGSPRPHGAALLFATVSALCFTPPAAAQTVDEEPVGRLTVGGVIGVQLPGMDDLNANLDVVNEVLAKDKIVGVDHMNTALVTGLDVRYKLSDRISLGLQWGALNATSEIDVTLSTVRLYSRSTTYQGSVYYHIPGVERFSERLQVMAGAGILRLESGVVEWSLEDRTSPFVDIPDLSQFSGSGKGTGTGTGFTIQGGATYMLSGGFSVAADVGYRFAKIGELTVDPRDVEGIEEGDPSIEPDDWAIWDFFLRDPNAELPDGRKRTDPRQPGTGQDTGCGDCGGPYYEGGPIEVDYSGPFTTISLRVHF